MPALPTPLPRPAPAAAAQATRRQALLALMASPAAIAARPARAAGELPPNPPPPGEESPLVAELRARSSANKAKYDAERLASYYKRNADALRVIDTPQLDPEIRKKIKAWLDANA